MFVDSWLARVEGHIPWATQEELDGAGHRRTCRSSSVNSRSPFLRPGQTAGDSSTDGPRSICRSRRQKRRAPWIAVLGSGFAGRTLAGGLAGSCAQTPRGAHRGRATMFCPRSSGWACHGRTSSGARVGGAQPAAPGDGVTTMRWVEGGAPVFYRVSLSIGRTACLHGWFRLAQDGRVVDGVGHRNPVAAVRYGR
jgi:hypothetical protein